MCRGGESDAAYWWRIYGGMLNAIGLQNPGIDVFCREGYSVLKQFDTKIVVNVCGRTTED